MPSSYQGKMRRDSVSAHEVSQSARSNLSTTASTVSNLLENKGGQIISIRPQETIAHAVEVLKTNGIGVLIVTDASGKLQGILSERDIVRKLADGPEMLSLTAVDLMTRKVVTCTPEEGIIQVLQKMTDGRFRHMPIMRDEELIGLISLGDLVSFRLRELEYEALKMKQMIVG
ncbi:MAG: CBS domain-containing protein [Pseudorhodobacter sp.]